MPSTDSDVVIVGGGHNGLVAAGLLARAGLCAPWCCERREVVGGAAVSEHPFGPRLHRHLAVLRGARCCRRRWSATLDLTAHGYHVYPQGPYFAPRRDGRYLRCPTTRPRRHEQIAKFSAPGRRRVRALGGRTWTGSAGSLGPLLGDIPPTLGSRRPGQLAGQARLLRRLQGRRRAGRRRHHPADVVVHRRPGRGPLRLRRDARRALGVRVIGTWAGPRSAGTAYVMLHHHIGDLGDGTPVRGASRGAGWAA